MFSVSYSFLKMKFLDWSRFNCSVKVSAGFICCPIEKSVPPVLRIKREARGATLHIIYYIFKQKVNTFVKIQINKKQTARKLNAQADFQRFSS